MKNNTKWFSHDYNSRSDGKILKLRMKHGMEGVGVYWCIVEMLYEQDGFMALNEYDRITFELRVNEELIRSVIHDFDLFELNCDKFWSNTGLERLTIRKDKSEKAKEAINARWEAERLRKLLITNNENTDVLPTNNDRNTTKDIIGNNSKGNNSKSGVPPHTPTDILVRDKAFYNQVAEFKDKYPKETLREFYEYWIEPNKSKTKMRFELQKTWDLNLRLKKWASNSFGGKKQVIKANEPPPNFSIIFVA